MARAYNVVDADGHILEPFDLWERYMDPAFRDRAPRIVKDNATAVITARTASPETSR